MSGLDKALDDIVKGRPRSGKGRKGGRKPGSKPGATGARARYSGGPVPAGPRAPAAASRVATSTGAPNEATKILLSNLPDDVNEAQIRELFSSTIGHTQNVTITYDSKGKSKGIASVVFKQKGCANRAYEQYNKRVIDGKRAMRVEIVVDPSQRPLAQRVAPAPAAAVTATNGASGAGKPVRNKPGRKRTARPKKTEADLDAEMEDYNTPATAAA